MYTISFPEYEYEEIETTATCSDPGTTLYKCSKCGREMSVRVDKSGHDYMVVEKCDPTCKELGKQTKKCKNCGDEIEEDIPTLPHVYGDWVETTAATVDHDGEETRVCIYCGHEDKKAIKFLEGMDMTYLEFNMDKAEYDINSFDDFRLYFFSALLNMKESLKLNIKMNFDEFNESNLTKNSSFSVKVE